VSTALAHRRAWLDLAAAALLALLAGLFLARTPLERDAQLELGAADSSSAAGFYGAEINGEGEPLRWTDGDGRVVLAARGPGTHLLTLRLAAPQAGPEAPWPATVSINGASVGSLQLPAAPRLYRLLVPATALRWSRNTVAIQSPTFAPPRDERVLGVVVFYASLRSAGGAPWLAPAQAAALGIAAWALIAALSRLGVGSERLLLGGLFIVIAVAMRQSDLRFPQRWSALLICVALAGGFALAALAPPMPPEVRPSRRAWWRRYAPVLALFAGLSALMYAPIWPVVTTHIVGEQADNYEYAWKLWWFAEALAGQGRSPTFVPQSFWPVGYELGLSEITPAHTLLGLPLTLLFGPVVSYNLIMWLSYALTGLATTMLAERLGAGRWPALVAGAAVAFCTFRIAHGLGLLPQMGSHWVVLTLYGWEGLLRRRRVWDGVVTATALAMAFWSSLYYGVTLVPLLGLYALIRLRPGDLVQLVRAWRPLLAAAIISTALLAPYAQPFIEAQAETTGLVPDEWALHVLAALPQDLVAVPPPFHPLRSLVGGTVWKRPVALGVAVVALGLVGLWLRRRERRAWALGVMALLTVLLALGPELHMGQIAIPLPVQAIHDHVPVLQRMRDWSRMVFYAQVALATLAALALTGLRARPAPGRVGLVALAILALAEAVYVPARLASLEPRPVDVWLAAQPGDGAVIQVPDTIGGPNIYASRFHWRPLTVGYGSFFPATYHENIGALVAFPMSYTVPLYRRLGVEYVVVRPEGMTIPGWRAMASGLPEVRLVYSDSTHYVYRVTPLAPPWRRR
jgi:hypothetical protein